MTKEYSFLLIFDDTIYRKTHQKQRTLTISQLSRQQIQTVKPPVMSIRKTNWSIYPANITHQLAEKRINFEIDLTRVNRAINKFQSVIKSTTYKTFETTTHKMDRKAIVPRCNEECKIAMYKM